MNRRGFFARVAGVLGLFGVGKLKAGGRVREQDELCSGCDEWPPLCDRCLRHGGVKSDPDRIDLTITLDGQAILRGLKRSLPDELDLRGLS